MLLEEYNELIKILGFIPPTDKILTAGFGEMLIDISALDDVFRYRYPEYEKCSTMKDFIDHKFGSRAAYLLTKKL